VPIIMITTEGAKTEVVEALKQGVTNYIVKPFTPEILVEKVKADFLRQGLGRSGRVQGRPDKSRGAEAL